MASKPLPDHSNRPPWPSEDLWPGRVEYKREPSRRGEWTSYFVATPAGLILGRAYSVVVGRGLKWHAEGWTPETDGWQFGPFKARWEAFTALLVVEVRGLRERDLYQRKGLARNLVESDETEVDR